MQQISAVTFGDSIMWNQKQKIFPKKYEVHIYSILDLILIKIERYHTFFVFLAMPLSYFGLMAVIAVPGFYREPTNHSNNRYFCMNDIQRKLRTTSSILRLLLCRNQYFTEKRCLLPDLSQKMILRFYKGQRRVNPKIIAGKYALISKLRQF